MNLKEWIALLSIGAFAFTMTACDSSRNAADAVGDAAEEAADSVGDAGRSAVDTMGDAGRNAADVVEDAAEDVERSME